MSQNCFLNSPVVYFFPCYWDLSTQRLSIENAENRPGASAQCVWAPARVCAEKTADTQMRTVSAKYLKEPSRRNDWLILFFFFFFFFGSGLIFYQAAGRLASWLNSNCIFLSRRLTPSPHLPGRRNGDKLRTMRSSCAGTWFVSRVRFQGYVGSAFCKFWKAPKKWLGGGWLRTQTVVSVNREAGTIHSGTRRTAGAGREGHSCCKVLVCAPCWEKHGELPSLTGQVAVMRTDKVTGSGLAASWTRDARVCRVRKGLLEQMMLKQRPEGEEGASLGQDRHTPRSEYNASRMCWAGWSCERGKEIGGNNLKIPCSIF